LPIDWTEFVLQFHDAARKESSDGAAGISEHTTIRGEARRFQGKDETIRRFVMPFGEGLRLLGAVKGAVDLDRCELTAGIFELTLLRQIVGVEGSPPRLVSPPADADPNRVRGCCSAHLLPFRSRLSGEAFQHRSV